MTSQNTPTKAPASTPARQRNRSTQPTMPQPRAAQARSDPRRTSSWLIWGGIAAALAAAVWLVVAGVANEYEAARNARSDQAYSARLQGLADKYEADRRTRSDQAYSARLQGLADKYEADRRTRSDQAYSARLQGLADKYQLNRPELFVAPAD